MSEKRCPCCSGALYEVCCEPFHQKKAIAPTAEALMRSRYSAYALADSAYLMNTTHVSTRAHYTIASIKKWAMENTWEKLEVLSTEKGLEKDSTGIVIFKAYYLDKEQKPQVHHEKSRFKKENGRWFFVDGVLY